MPDPEFLSPPPPTGALSLLQEGLSSLLFFFSPWVLLLHPASSAHSLESATAFPTSEVSYSLLAGVSRWGSLAQATGTALTSLWLLLLRLAAFTGPSYMSTPLLRQ